MPNALKITAPGNLQLATDETPSPAAGEVLLRVKAGGICGSDLHIYDGSHPVGDYPKILGHEFAGVVEEIGPGVSGVAPGDTVTADPIIACGQCRSCRVLRRPNICAKLRVRGVHADGGFRTHIVLPEASVHRFGVLDWQTAVLTEPFAVAAQIVDRSRLNKDDTVLITGTGAIGLAVLLLARHAGARVIASDLHWSHLDKATELGAYAVVNPTEFDLADKVRELTGGEGVSVIIESVGTPAKLKTALRCAAPGARIAVIGFDTAPLAVSPCDITINEWELIGSRINTNKFDYVIDLFESGRIDPKVIVSHRFPFTDAPGVFPFILENPAEVTKIILEF